MMFSNFFKILSILLAIAVIVEKVQAKANDTTTAKPKTQVPHESKNTTEGLQCYSSDGWKSHTNHTNQTIDCKHGHCFGAWLTGEYMILFVNKYRSRALKSRGS